MKLREYYSIHLIVGSSQDGWFMLHFRGRAMLARKTVKECKQEMERHYQERKSRNFANMDLEQGHVIGWLDLPNWTGSRR